MSTVTENVKVDESSFFSNAKKSFVTFKDKYCPDGQTCDTILTFGLLIGMVRFM